jgi:hypothetical protein
MVTTAAAIILEGSTSALVAAETEQAGAAWNLGDGCCSLLRDAVPGITAVANEAGWLTSPSRDTESDADFRERLRLKWWRQSGWHTAYTSRSLISDVTGIDPGEVYFDLSGCAAPARPTPGSSPAPVFRPGPWWTPPTPTSTRTASNAWGTTCASRPCRRCLWRST